MIAVSRLIDFWFRGAGSASFITQQDVNAVEEIDKGIFGFGQEQQVY